MSFALRMAIVFQVWSPTPIKILTVTLRVGLIAGQTQQEASPISAKANNVPDATASASALSAEVLEAEEEHLRQMKLLVADLVRSSDGSTKSKNEIAAITGALKEARDRLDSFHDAAANA